MPLFRRKPPTLPLRMPRIDGSSWPDRRDVERRSFAKPKSLSEVAFVVPWVCLGLPADVRDHTFATAGGPFRLLWLLTRRRFARKQRLAFGS